MTEPKPVVLRGLRRDGLGTLWTLREDGLWESTVNGAVFPLAEVDAGPYGPTREVIVAGWDPSSPQHLVIRRAIAWRNGLAGISDVHAYDAVKVIQPLAEALVAAVDELPHIGENGPAGQWADAAAVERLGAALDAEATDAG